MCPEKWERLNLKYDIDYNISECNFFSAEHSILGDITNELYNIDSLYTYVSPSTYIEAKFLNKPQDINSIYSKRDYLIEINGRIMTLDGYKKNNIKNILKHDSYDFKKNIINNNYPNPFNPTTKISYSLATASFVSLEVFDVLGRKVGCLVNEYKNAGNYMVEFDGSNLSSGIYFYKFKAGNTLDIKKMILIK